MTTTKDKNTPLEPLGPGSVLPYQREGIVNLARRFAQVLLAAVSEATPADGLKNEFGLLVAISHASGLEQKTLGAVMALDLTTISQLVDVLEGKGYVRRVASPSDRRAKLVEITAAGQRFVGEHRPAVIKVQSEVLSVLTQQERQVLTDMLARVIQANPQYDRPGGGRRAPRSKGD